VDCPICRGIVPCRHCDDHGVIQEGQIWKIELIFEDGEKAILHSEFFRNDFILPSECVDPLEVKPLARMKEVL